MAEEKSKSPLSTEAQTAKEEMQEQLMRRMAAKVVDTAAEEERQRRVKEKLSVEEEELRSKAFDKLILVQEDLVRYVNQMKVRSFTVEYLITIVHSPQVKEAEEFERSQRITEENKAQVHEELLRKAVQKEVR